MANADQIQVPLRFTAGDAFAVSVTPSAEHSDVEWAHALTLVKLGARIQIAGVLSDGVVSFAVAPAAWAPGRYAWHYTATLGAARHTVAAGQVEVLPDPSAAHDPRSHARKVLDAIEAYLENADYSASRTRIADRELQNIPIPELLALRDRYRSEVRSEEISSGFRLPSRILTRF